MALPIAVQSAFAFGCADSAQKDVDLSVLATNVDFTVTPSSYVTIDGDPAIMSIAIDATTALVNIKTSVIDGSNIVCTALVGTIKGTSDCTSDGKPFCLADADIESATVESYAGKGSTGALTASWSNTSSGATGTESLTVWIADAGQSYVEVE